jgi:protein TonB
MFDQLIASGGLQVPTQRPLSLTLALLIHGLAVGLLLLFPMMFPQTMVQQIDQLVRMIAPALPLPSSSPPPGHQPAKPNQREAVFPRPLTAPAAIPTSVTKLIELPPPELEEWVGNGPQVPGGEPGRKGAGMPGGDPWSQQTTPVPPQPEPVKPEPSRLERLKVSEGVQAARLMWKESPPYPPLARINRVQGSVVLTAVIGPEGGVEELRVLSGHPLLIQAAMEAVKKWHYRPTLLNGEPVRVETTIVVNFLLR